MRRKSGVLWIAAGAVLWGTDTVFRRPLAGALGSTQIVFYEHLILTAIVLPILIRNRVYLRKISVSVWAALIATAWLGSALATVLFTAAIRSGSPTTAVLLQKAQPLFAILLARVLLRERLPAGFPIVALVAILGTCLVAFGNNLSFAVLSVEVGPAVLALAAAAGWGLATVCGRVASRALPFELVTALRVAIALPALFAGAIIQRQTAVPTLDQGVSLVWIALIPGFAALLVYYRGLRRTPASHATIAELAFPATASFLNWYILSVAVSALQLFGFAIVFGAIIWLSRHEAR